MENSKKSPTQITNSIDIYPTEVVFEDIQLHQFYQINVYIRNQTNLKKKVRIIHPLSPQFRVQCEDDQKFIAPGLSWKLSVMFSFNGKKANLPNTFEDNITVLGDDFKTIIPIKAYRTQQQLEIPQIIKVGNLKVGKEYTFNIPIKNKGKIQASFYVNHLKESLIDIPTKQYTLRPGKTQNLQFKIKSKKVGQISEEIKISNKLVKVKGIFIDEQIDIVDRSGDRLSMKDFGEILIGQPIEEVIHIINNTSKRIDCLCKIFNKQFADYHDIKIDEKRLNFVCKLSPQNYIKQVKETSSKCQDQRFFVEPFSDFENKIKLLRKPTQKQIDRLRKSIVKRNEQQLNDGMINSSGQLTQTMVCKVEGEDRLIKIMIKYIPIMPKVYVDTTSIQFGNILPKDTAKKSFKIKNVSSRSLLLNYHKAESFRMEGPSKINPSEQLDVVVEFHPVVMGKYSQTMQITIFQCWQIDIKVFGTCPSEILVKNKNYFNTFDQNMRGVSVESHRFKTLKHNYLNLSSKCSRKAMRSIDQNSPPENQLAMLINPAIRDPDTKIGIIKSDLFYKTQHKILNGNKKMQMSHPVHLRDILKYSQQLSLAQLEKIQVQDQKLDFGSIFINSVSKKNLIVKNKNQRQIMFEIDFDKNESLMLNKSDKKIIPSMSQVIFQITLKPNQLGALKIPISYIINNQHIFQIEINAFVTLVNLEISTKTLNFCFKQNQLIFQKTQQLVIHNYGNTLTKFTFVQPENKCFTLNKLGGELEAHSSMSVNVCYSPKEGSDLPQSRIDNDKIVMKVHGGAQNIIRCIGTVNEVKSGVKQTQLIFPTVLVSYPTYAKLTIRNYSKFGTSFKIQLNPPSLSQYLTINCKPQSLFAEQRKQLNLLFVCDDVKKVQGYLTLVIRGSKSIKIPFEANVIYPIIQANNQSIDFGTMPIMSNHCQFPITLKNMTNIEIKLDFGKQIKDESYSLQMNPLKEDTLEMTYYDKDERSLKKYQNINLAVRDRDDSVDKSMENMSNKFIKLLPGVETQFLMKFVPKSIKQFNFFLPLKVYGTRKIVEPLHLKIKCNAIEPLIYLYPPDIDFEEKIITEKKHIFIKDIKLINPHDRPTKWRLVPDDNALKPFIANKLEGIIEEKSSESIEVTFKPKSQGVYTSKFKIFLNDMKISYFEIKASGTAILPTICFNINQVILPVVPLGVESKTILKIQNHGYDTITICKWKTSNQFQFVDIRVNFLEGKLLSLAKKSLKVEVSFVSLVSISFTTMLELYDEFGNKYQLPLSATSQNCIFTTYPFLEDQNQHNIIHDPADNVIKILGCNRSYSSEKEGVSGLSRASCSFIAKWLNFEINLCISDYPEDMIKNDGEMLMKMINRISNKSMVRKQQIVGDKVTRVMALYEYYCQIIHSLKVEGAFLNHIRPEYLLSTDDYITFITNKKMLMNDDEVRFELLSTQSWIVLFYQLCKLYVMPQINEKSMQKVFKVEKLPTSTIYSHEQVIVLKYMSSFIADEGIYSFGQQLKVLEIIQKILEKFFMVKLSQQLTSLKLSMAVMAPHQFMPLLSQFLYTQLKQFGLSMFLEPNDLFVMNQKEICLYMVSLITMVLQYANTHVIKFEASIGQKVIKKIELENPSNKKIKYWVKIIANEDFQAGTNQIILPPKEKTQLSLSYHCKVNRDQDCKLLLIPIKEEESIASAQPLSFLLKTAIISKILVRKINISVCMYEIAPINLDIQLPYQPIDANDVEFTLSLVEDKYIQSFSKTSDNMKFIDTPTPSFFFNQNPLRMVKDCRDRIQIKVVSLVMEKKSCKVIYSSNLYGEFVYEINLTVDLPTITKQIRLKNLKVSKEEICQVIIPKQNQLFLNALKFLNDHQIKIKKPNQSNKYNVTIPESQYFKCLSETLQIQRSVDGKDIFKVDLSANFTKPYKQYSFIIIIRCDALKDVRVYRILTSVSTLPKVINLFFKTQARQQLVNKIPIKVAPCSTQYTGNCPWFKIEHLAKQYPNNCEVTAIFNPPWMMEDDVSLILENQQNLEQTIYKIKLQALQPLPTDSITVYASTIFNRVIRIPIKFERNQQLEVKSQFVRDHKINDRCLLTDNEISLEIFAGDCEEEGMIKFYRLSTDQYYWVKVTIKNKSIKDLGKIILIQKINQCRSICFQKVDANSNNFEYFVQKSNDIRCEVVSEGGKKKFYIHFSPLKQCSKIIPIYFNAKQDQYSAEMHLTADTFPLILLPDIVTTNIQQKHSFINVINSSSYDGKYQVQLEGSKCFKVQKQEIELKAKEKYLMKVIFCPNYYNQLEKGIIKFTSNELPDYQYLLTGYSQFHPTIQSLQFQSFEGSSTEKSILFKNLSAKKDTFSFEITPPDSPFIIISPKIQTLQLKPLQQRLIKISNIADTDSKFQQATLLIKSTDKKLWTYQLKLFTIKNLGDKTYVWNCKARQTIFENLQLPANFTIVDLQTQQEIKKFLTFSLDDIELNQVKMKFSPMKTIKKKTYSIVVVGVEYKFRIICHICVSQPNIDDTIMIKTENLNQVSCVSFKLTNVVKQHVKYNAYFEKQYSQLSVDPPSGILEPYGKIGSTINIKFKSTTNNKKIQDRLFVETEDMCWIFKIKAQHSKK